MQRLTHDLVEAEASNGRHHSIAIDIDNADNSTVTDGEVGSEELLDDHEIDPLTVRLVHHVKIEHQREYEVRRLNYRDWGLMRRLMRRLETTLTPVGCRNSSWPFRTLRTRLPSAQA